LIFLHIAQPLAIIARHKILQLADSIFLADRRDDLRDRLPNALLICLCRLGHSLWQRSRLTAAARRGRAQPISAAATLSACAASCSARVGRLLLVILAKY